MKKESVFQSRVVLLIPFLFLAAAYAWRQSSFPAYTGDDVAFFAYALNEGSLWQFIVRRFQTRTSRVLWEPITVLILQGPAGVFLWRVGSVLCVVFLAWFTFQMASRVGKANRFLLACASCVAIYYVP